MRKTLLTAFFLCFTLKIVSQPINHQVINTKNPWTYWWWQGSAVSKGGITAQLEYFKKSGIGGAHIIPIYGVKGEESHFLRFLSKEWLGMFNYTCSEANRLGLGIDLSTGTGWPFGGPSITSDLGAKQLVFTEASSSDSLRIKNTLRKSIYGKGDIFIETTDGYFKQIDKLSTLNNFIDSNICKLLIITYEPTKQFVKRAAPGGEGLVLDHFDPIAMSHYLNVFDSTLLAGNENKLPRAMYNDSYEVYNANWTTGFFHAFQKQHNYDLNKIIYALSPSYPDCQLKERVISDYRETLASLLFETEKSWTNWASKHKMITRYQAHGSPGNLADLYALSDIPETESFGSSNFKIPRVRVDNDYQEKGFGRPNPLMMKFASSPAHILGKKLVASESTTWLGNHFKVALSQIKPQIDELFTAGINHIFFHGTTYSPPEAPFPGWLFYASTNYGSHSHFSGELPLLTQYIANCQKLLQESEPDNDILVYLPIYDFWANTKEPLLSLFSVHHADKWFLNTPFGELATRLWEGGYSFDYISDMQISNLKINSDRSVSICRSKYKTIIIPKTTHIPAETFEYLAKLSRKGVRIIFDESLPLTLPGNGRDKQKLLFNSLKEELDKSKDVIVGRADSALKVLNVRHEFIVSSGLTFIRKQFDKGHFWFITNLSNEFYNDSISLSGRTEALEYYNPMNGDRGFIDFKKSNQRISTKLYLPPGSSCFLISYNNSPKRKTRGFPYPSKESFDISNWEVKFTKGSPALPKTIFHPRELTSWTTWSDSTLLWFNGYATYTNKFKLPQLWSINTGVYIRIDDLRETAQVTINGRDIGTIWSVPYELFVPMTFLKPRQENTITLQVRNLSGNEARYMDTRHIKWKKFYDANIVDITYNPFDASKWDPIPSGIIGNVKVIAVK